MLYYPYLIFSFLIHGAIRSDKQRYLPTEPIYNVSSGTNEVALRIQVCSLPFCSHICSPCLAQWHDDDLVILEELCHWAAIYKYV